jgi:hypothetical protein
VTWCAVHEGPATCDPCDDCLIWRFSYYINLARERKVLMGTSFDQRSGRTVITERTPFGTRIQTVASGRP